MDRILAAFVFGLCVIGATFCFTVAPHYEFVGATPKGVIVFDSTTGSVEVRRPIQFPTSTTEPQKQD